MSLLCYSFILDMYTVTCFYVNILRLIYLRRFGLNGNIDFEWHLEEYVRYFYV